MTELICGKVARVLNSREIAINVGSGSGVEVGMYFAIMDTKFEDITDPDTGKKLGSIKRPKVRVKVTQVKEKLSIASTYEKKEINVGGSGTMLGEFSRALMPPKWKVKYKTFKTEEKPWEDIDEKESYVKVGDPVVQVIPEDIDE